MSIMQPALVDARVLDLFAGSGALGLEALSRGAREVDFVESGVRSLTALRENAVALGAGDTAHIHPGDAMRFIEGLQAEAYDVAFADPPYRMGLAARVAGVWLATPFARILGIEHERGEELPEAADVRKYGDTLISIYKI